MFVHFADLKYQFLVGWLEDRQFARIDIGDDDLVEQVKQFLCEVVVSLLLPASRKTRIDHH